MNITANLVSYEVDCCAKLADIATILDETFDQADLEAKYNVVLADSPDGITVTGEPHCVLAFCCEEWGLDYNEVEMDLYNA